MIRYYGKNHIVAKFNNENISIIFRRGSRAIYKNLGNRDWGGIWRKSI